MYQPYGNVMSSAGSGASSYTFTGKWQDATNLIFLRARFYSPAQGRFIQHDSWPGDYNRPQTRNGWAYVEGNPINRTDPSGQRSVGDDAQDPRDLTSWLYREMATNVKDSRLELVTHLNTFSQVGVGGGAVIVAGGVVCLNPIIAGAGALTIAAGGLSFYGAKGAFSALVGDHATWDFKHRINDKLGKGITLCTAGGCQTDIEYSVPGNIHFGFVARQAGYAPAVIQFGAGDAEINDPAHTPTRTPEGALQFTPYDGNWGIVNGPAGLTFNFGDNAQDHQAVQAGIYMYDHYGADVTYSEFLTALGMFLPVLDRQAPSPAAVKPEIASQWPYPVGFFDPTR
jgi:RHS repeat-associated protein